MVPEMRPAEWRAFVDDVRSRGVVTPLHVAPDGSTLLDGRHRHKAAIELNLRDVPVIPADLAGATEIEYVIRAALLRRHLSDDQRAVLAARLAEALSSVRRSERARAAADARWRPPARGSHVTKEHAAPSRELAAVGLGVPVRKVRLAGALNAVAPQLAERVLAGDLRLREAEAQWNRQRHIDEISRLPAPTLDDRAQIWIGDFRRLATNIPPGSVDLVLTDPPYNKAGIPLWTDLADLAKRVLKPGGFLVAYSGHLFLPEVMTRLSESLDYYWMASMPFRGQKPSIRERQVRTGFRIILIYVKPPITEKPWFFDVVEADAAPDKRYHDWGQTVKPGRYLVSRFSGLGDLVLDPFCGAGTFPVAAVLEGRRTIGVELNSAHAKVARKRVALALHDKAIQKTSGTGDADAA